MEKVVQSLIVKILKNKNISYQFHQKPNMYEDVDLINCIMYT